MLGAHPRILLPYLGLVSNAVLTSEFGCKIIVRDGADYKCKYRKYTYQLYMILNTREILET